MHLSTTQEYATYLLQIEKTLNFLYALSKKARKKGIDPTLEPEPHVAKDLAEMVEGLIGPPGVAKRIRELSQKMSPHEIAFVIASDISLAKFGQVTPDEAAEQAIRTALAIMTGGITAAPLQGIAYIKIKQNADHTRYLAIYFAGPIRSAAGTEQALTPVIGDFIRRRLGLDRYKPTDLEINRFIEEIRLYEREVRGFQYHVSDDVLTEALRNLPIEITGTESDPYEVSSFRNLPRIETNRIRGGALLVLNDGIVGRSKKVWRIIEELDIDGWNWLQYLNESKEQKKEPIESLYMKDIIAGRPIFSFPATPGGFRLRYGRSRNTGLAALGIHPATMIVLQNFLASGTQLRVEGPGKGGVVLPVDTIEPPIVLLKDGSVVKIETASQATLLKRKIKSILFIGDLLVSFGEFLETNKPLVPSGYTEEWWVHDVYARIQRAFKGSIKQTAEALGFSSTRLKNILYTPLLTKPTAQEALQISKKLDVPLHPTYTYFWKEIELEELPLLRRAINQSEKTKKRHFSQELRLQHTPKIKNILERLCIPHKLEDNTIVIGSASLILTTCLQTEASERPIKNLNSIISTITALSGIPLREKGLTYIGARMGRPEKARMRQMSPPVHGLFPIGLEGGPRRNIVEAVKKGVINVELVRRRCPTCNETTYKLLCPQCQVPTILTRVCPRCNHLIDGAVCNKCKTTTVSFNKRPLNLRRAYEEARKNLTPFSTPLVKGVKGMLSETKTPEALEKAILRAKHNLSVYKDGTIRFDATNTPITHFKPIEIGLSLDDLQRLGYIHDMYGAPLKDLTQMCELKVQDVIIPQSCAKYFIQICNFIDELLQDVYDLPSYYNVTSKQELIGHLLVGFAPHTSGGVVGRILGFTKMQVCYAHPLWHNIKRRDCDGDEDALMLMLDVLLNFSKAYLPSRIGGIMDAPFLLISVINPFEVDEAQHLDVGASYPPAFYSKTLEHADPKTISEIIDVVEHRLGTPAQFEGYSFTHQTSDINAGNQESAYKKLGSMANKLKGQFLLADKLKAVNSEDVATRVLTTHLLRDIAGNLKAFTGQKFRCKTCNTKYRRVPLSSKCFRCGGEIMITVHKKSIEKYLDLADNLIQKYSLNNYYAQRLALIRDEINSLFAVSTGGKKKQVKLGEFM
ncbi:MAG: DNA polymerase II large subunit [Candidatus Hermodarchaeia archaeon]|jgi:DNA polymerase II large subunit